MAENIVTGKKYRILKDVATKTWDRISFWSKASDIEFNDGKTAETKLGVIDGITSDVNGESETIAASIKAVNEVNTSLGGLSFYEDSTGKYVVGADAVPKKLGSNSARFVTEVTKNTSNAISIDCTGVEGWQSFTSKDFLLTDITTRMHIYGGSSTSGNRDIVTTFDYDNTTGVLKLSGLFGGSSSYNYVCAYNFKVWVMSDMKFESPLSVC